MIHYIAILIHYMTLFMRRNFSTTATVLRSSAHTSTTWSRRFHRHLRRPCTCRPSWTRRLPASRSCTSWSRAAGSNIPHASFHTLLFFSIIRSAAANPSVSTVLPPQGCPLQSYQVRALVRCINLLSRDLFLFVCRRPQSSGAAAERHCFAVHGRRHAVAAQHFRGVRRRSAAAGRTITAMHFY